MKLTGAGTMSLLTGRRLDAAETSVTEQIVGEVDTRIHKYRRGDVVLRLVGPNGKPLEPSGRVKIEQINHAFLFGCNIFKLDRCSTAEDNANYEKHFATLLNFATLPF